MDKKLVLICGIIAIFLTIISVIFIKGSDFTFTTSDIGIVFPWHQGKYTGTAIYALVDLPTCQKATDFYTDAGSPKKKYILVDTNNRFNFENYLYTNVRVIGKVTTKQNILKPPEIVCIKAPCEAKVIDKTFEVERIESTNKELSLCQKEYLDDLKHSPRF